MGSRVKFLVITAALAVSGCGSLGDTGAVRDASELAIACRHDEALALLDRAEQSGGLSKYIAELQRVVFLRDVGRDREAATLLQQRNERIEASAEDAAEAEAAVQESLAELRKEREEQTGRAGCASIDTA